MSALSAAIDIEAARLCCMSCFKSWLASRSRVYTLIGDDEVDTAVKQRSQALGGPQPRHAVTPGLYAREALFLHGGDESVIVK
jgi:hypothetical protein